MADSNIATERRSNKPTFIYGLVDPRSDEIRYIGKTILSPARRLAVHLWRARTAPKKRHSMAWLLGLHHEGLSAIVETLEVIAPGGDWVEAEQFWISALRLAGARLCNHTIGGEGQIGYRQPKEMVEKRIRRGKEHHQTGKSMPPHVMAALQAGAARARADPILRPIHLAKQRAGMTPEKMAASVLGLRSVDEDPIRRKSREVNRLAAIRTERVRLKAAVASKKNWAMKRDQIIAAQNTGKGREYRIKQSEIRKAAWKAGKYAAVSARRSKLRGEVLAKIRVRVINGESQTSIAREMGIAQSAISRAIRDPLR